MKPVARSSSDSSELGLFIFLVSQLRSSGAEQEAQKSPWRSLVLKRPERATSLSLKFFSEFNCVAFSQLRSAVVTVHQFSQMHFFHRRPYAVIDSDCEDFDCSLCIEPVPLKLSD